MFINRVMKIAVYGDSYAKVAREEDGRKSWVDYLSEEFDVTNYGEIGSNLAFSYQPFLENHKKYEVNIFLVTSYGRLYVPELSSVPKGIAGFPTVEFNLKYCTNPNDRKILQAAHDYYVYLENDNHQRIMHVAMIKDILRHTNTVVIPCFDAQSLVPNWEGPALSRISKLDDDYYDITSYIVDKRPCHLNDLNNKIFAGKIKEYILSNRHDQFTINLSDYHIAVGEGFDYNFFEQTDTIP
jgi:hypothetical protein